MPSISLGDTLTITSIISGSIEADFVFPIMFTSCDSVYVCVPPVFREKLYEDVFAPVSLLYDVNDSFAVLANSALVPV